MRRIIFSLLILFSFSPAELIAKPQAASPIKLGFVGSLSSFAANYGSAVLEGAKLASDELMKAGIVVDLKIEDDQSIAKNSVTAYTKLRNIDKVSAIIGGTWWANSFVKQVERDHIPLLSCESLFNDDVVLSDTHFIMNGDLRNWVKVYEPLVRSKGWKRGVIVRYISGFGATLAREFETLFSIDDRTFLGAIEYPDIDMSNAADIALKLRKLNPDVVYIDAQPAGLANLLKKLSESGMTKATILTNSIADVVRRDNLFDLSLFTDFYFTRRESFNSVFEAKFKDKYGKAPYLNADLGYYAVYLATKALENSDPITTLKNGFSVQGRQFLFDDNNVYSGIRQEIFRVQGSEIEPFLSPQTLP